MIDFENHKQCNSPFSLTKEKEETKIIENNDSGEPELRREYHIEKVLPSVFPQSTLFQLNSIDKFKTIKGHVIEEKWVDSLSHSSSLKLKGGKNLTPSSPNCILGLFPAGNYETSKSKELASRNSDGLLSESISKL